MSNSGSFFKVSVEGQKLVVERAMSTLSEHFAWSEFGSHDEYDKGALVVNDYFFDLVARLERLRGDIASKFGEKPIIITSGYRNPAYNKRVGGAPKSWHLVSGAADIIVPGLTSRVVADMAEPIFGGVFTYDKKPHTHVDVRPEKVRRLINVGEQ